MKITEAFDLYKNEFIRARNQSFRVEETHEYVRRSIATYLGDINIRKLTLDQIGAWREELSKGRCGGTVRSYIVRLRRVLYYCRTRGYKCINPDLIQVPKRDDHVPSFLTPEEVSKIINSTHLIRTKLIISMLYCSGVRCTELCNINRDAIRDRQFSVIGKGGKARICFIDTRTEKLLQEYMEERTDRNSALIVTTTGNRMRRGNVELIVRNAVKHAGIDKKITPHTFRHSYATDLLKGGMNIRALADCMGHSSLDTTKVYTHIVNTELFDEYEKSHSF